MSAPTAFLGTGLIGAAFAEAALARGVPVVAWNRTPERAAPLTALGARVVAELADAVRGARRIHLALTADAAVDAVLDALTPHLDEGAIVVDHSTTSAAGAVARAARAAASGVAFLHAPVFMSPEACRAAQGVMVVAGPRAVFDRAQADLAPMTGTLLFAGEDPGAAAATKLVGNAMILAMVGGFADALTVADAQGLAPDAVRALFEAFDVRAVIRGRGGRMIAGDRTVSWTLATARKDLGLMRAAVGARPLAVLPGLGERMDALIADGEAEEDVGILGRDAR